MSKFEDLLNKARRQSAGKRPPYVIEIDEERYEIAYPDAQAYLEMSTLDEGETLAQLRIVFRDEPYAFNALMRSLRGEPAEVIELILNDMFETWNDDSIKQPGKSKPSGA